MKFHVRFLTDALGVLVLVAGVTVAIGQTTPAKNETKNLAGPQEILHELAPDTIPLDSLNPKPDHKARAIRMLMVVKHQDTGWNRQLAVYLLALLGYDYERNRDELLQVWHHCVVKDFDEDCDERTAMSLAGLYQQGHKELLRPLLAGSRNSDGALSEELFPFYLARLMRDPKEFLSAVATFSPADQTQICKQTGEEACEEAGGGPGNGKYPKSMRTVLYNLQKTDGRAAGRCSHAVIKGYREMAAAIQEEEKGPQGQPK